MSQFLARRVIESALTLLLVAIVVFLAVRLTPGDPAELLLPRGASPEQIEQLRERWGLDQPMLVQLGAYLRNLARGDLGESLTYREPVSAIIADRLPATLKLAAAAMTLAITVAVPLGIIASLRPGSKVDTVVMMLVIATQSVPSFWLGVQLILIFSLSLGWLPSAGSEGWRYLILPAVTLSADVTALLTRVVRTEMGRALRQDYVRTAYAKGLARPTVLTRHAFRNAANPLVTVIGLRFGALLGGAVITETIFAWPGIGRLAIQSVSARDYPLIQGIVLVAAAVFIVIHLLVDLIYAVLDPRVRLAES
jgi:peptide/nickel transport system permease protein